MRTNAGADHETVFISSSAFCCCCLRRFPPPTAPRRRTLSAHGPMGFPPAGSSKRSCDPYIDYGCVANNRMVTAAKAAAAASGYCDPYVNYKCLDAYLGDSFFTRFYRYYELEWGKGVAPADPHAPAGSRSDAAWPPTPQSLSADAIRRMAVWRHAEYRQNAAELGGFAANGCARQYASSAMP